MNGAMRRERRRWWMRSRRILFSARVPLLFGGLAGLVLAAAAGAAGAGMLPIVLSFLFGLLAVGLPIHVVQTLAERVIDEMHRLVNIRPLVGDALLGASWAMDAPLAFDIANLVDQLRPSLVFECGSGTSTLLIAERLRRAGGGRVVSIESGEEFAAATNARIAAAGLQQHATVLYAPLVERSSADGAWTWYAPTYEAELKQPIDLLIVDGPPGLFSPDARYPALPLLREHLAQDVVILLDDGDRDDERAAAFRWARELPGGIRYRPVGRGRWLVWRGGRKF